MHKVLRPLMFIAEIFCLIPFGIDSNENDAKVFVPFRKSLFYYARLSIILSVVIGSILYKQFVIPLYDSKSVILNAVEFAHYNCRLIGTTVCILSINFYNAPIVDFLNSLKNLEKAKQSMNYIVNYKQISSLPYIMITILFIKLIIMEIPYYVSTFYDNLVDILDFIIFNIPLLLIHVMSLQWIIYLALLKAYLKSLNELLRTLKYQRCWVIKDFSKIPAIPTIEMLKECGYIYRKLCAQSRTINKAFAWQFLFILPGFFIEIVLRSFNVCQTIKNKTSLQAITVISDVIHFVVILEIVLPCVSVKEQSIKFADSLTKVNINSGNEGDFEEVMSNMLLQTYHQRIEFSAHGVFALDGSLIYSILGALTTYLVILLQFDF